MKHTPITILLYLACTSIFSCDNKANVTILDNNAEKGNDITVLFKGSFLKDTIQHGDGSFSRAVTPTIAYFSSTDILLGTNDVSENEFEKTVKIVNPSSQVILQRKISYDDFDFLVLEPGDSVEISLDSPSAKLLNRTPLKYDLGLSEINQGLPISRRESYDRNQILLINMLSSEELKIKKIANHNINIDKANEYYINLLKKIDSVYQLNQMSETSYFAYKTYYSFKGMRGDEILAKIDGFSIAEQDSVFKYPYFRDPLYYKYSKYGYKDIIFSSGRGLIDYRVVIDTILAHQDDKLSTFTSDLLLYEFMGRLAQSQSSMKVVNTYFEKFKGSVYDTTLITALSANYFFDDIQVNSKSEVELLTFGDEKVTLSSLLKASNDSIFYIDFWASWCAPCIAEMPASKKLSEELENDSISIIYLSIDKKIENWKKSATRLGLDDNPNSLLVVNTDSSQFLQEINLGTIPRYLILNKEGKLLQSNAPSPSSEQIREVLETLLSKGAI